MATKRVSPERPPSLEQLADSIADDAFRSAFETYMEALIKHHPQARNYPREFLKAWRRKLEWAERSELRERGS
jgi:hypothetical protein